MRVVHVHSCVHRLVGKRLMGRLATFRTRCSSAVAAALLVLSGPFALSAQPPLPDPVGYVNDFAGVLTPESRARIEALATRVNELTRGDLVVVTLADLGGRTKEEVALRLGRTWKIGANSAIGDSARNAGVVILVVPKETSADGRGHCRIETGQGTEGFITDATAGAICRDAIPLFQARDYAGALEQISASVGERYARNFGVNLDGTPAQRRSRDRGNDGKSEFPIALLVAVIVFVVLPLITGRRRGCLGCLPIPSGNLATAVVLNSLSRNSGWGGSSGGWGGGGGGGGFGGFGGGGGFSGGGGGSDW